MSENVSDSQLTPKQLQAVQLLALDDLSDEQIAEQVGVRARTLYRWKHEPAVQAAISDAKQVIADAIRLEGIANKQNRITAQVERWNALEQIRQARAVDEQLTRFPGGETGFVTAELKLVKVIDETSDDGTNVSYREFWVHGFDASLWNAYLSVEKMTAQETGQWEDKLNVNGSLKREYVIVTEVEDTE
jgi:predicted DNA-binding protein (UPF0251 family)